MGSEQSHQAGPSNSATASDLTAFASRGVNRDASLLSPRQESVCSDSEVPYISYTVNKPIGESPKKISKYRFASPRLSKRSVSAVDSGASQAGDGSVRSKLGSRKFGRESTLVVVNKPESESSLSNNPELKRLQEIPAFLPIMRASLSATSGSGGSVVKDPDILERLDNRGLVAICQRYEDHLRTTASVVSTQQAEICRSIREVDERLAKLSTVLTDRQRQYAKHVEQLKKVGEMSKVLTKCHLLLNENLEQLDILNSMLPCDERFEPFVWTTG